MKENIIRTTCRLCGDKLTKPIISLGNQYINDFPEDITLKGRNGRCPLDIVLCENCDLYQLLHTAPQELLYSRHYWYKSGINDTIQKDLKEISELASDIVDIKESDVFLDIGANDGTLLSNLKNKCITVGCEPASNLADDLKTNCDYQIHDFWNVENYEKLGIPKAKVITAIGMFYDMEDPNQFIGDAAKVMHEDGIFIAQLMTLKPMLDNKDLGNICHEHLEYYTYKSLKYLFETNGLEIYKIEENAINGGSYRIFARHLNKGSIDYHENITKQDVIDFMGDVDSIKLEIKTLIEKLQKEGKKIYGYGASTKGNVICQYFDLTNSEIIAIADKNPAKEGLFTLTDIPVISEEEARKSADVFFILPYGFTEEFIIREKEWVKNGGILVSPLPYLRVIEKDYYES
jgi:hypothetical protein